MSRWLKVAFCLSLPFLLPALPAAGDEILPFDDNDTLEEIRYKIDHNGYSFTVSDNPIFSMPAAEKAAYFSRRPPRQPRALTASDEIGPLADHLGKRALPASFDWRDVGGRSYIGDVRDQGSCGSCYAFGANAAAEGTYNYAMGLYDGNCVDFSESYIIWCLGRLPQYNSHFYGCDGADFDYAELDALVEVGVTFENNFPYQESDPGSCTHWGDQTVAFESWHRIDCNDIDAIKTAIMTYGVVDAAVYVGSAFQAYDSGVYEDSNTTCYSSPCYYTPTNHAISLVGWDDNPPEGGGGVWILRNSWGDSSWGEDGYMRIRFTSARASCEACYLVFDAPITPTPTLTPVGYKTATPTATPTPTPAICTKLDERFDGFDTGTRPSGWVFSGCDQNSDTYTTAGDYGASSPSIKLDNNGDSVTSAEFDGGEWLQFWVKGQSTDVSSSLLVEEEYYVGWATLATIQPLPAAGRLYTGLALNPSSTQVRFTYSKSVGDLALDDILVKCIPSPTPFGYKTPTPVPTATPAPTATPPPTPGPGWNVFLYEDFEEDWPGWTEEPIIGNEPWWMSEGSPYVDGIPAAAYEGTYNALFFYDDYDNKSTRLISPRIQFPADTSQATLTFWHAQADYEGYHETVIVYYRTSASGTWQQLASYQEAVNSWTRRELELPQTSEDYYISFLPSTDYGWGLCIDAVEVSAFVGPTPIPVPTAVICTRIDERFDGFDSGTRPAGWTFSGCDQDSDTYTTAGDYGASSPSIKLDNTGDSVTSADFVDGEWLQFWVKGVGTDATSSLLVEEEYYAGWVTLAAIQPLPSAGTLYTGLTLNPAAERVRFTYTKSAGDLALDDVMVSCLSGPTPVPPETPTPVPPVKTPTPVPPVRTPTPTPVPRWIYDYNGDGLSDIAIFRPDTGLWAVRGITRLYFGASSDLPVPGDYRGDGTTIPAVFRPSTGLWATRGLSRMYFGNDEDLPRPFDYDGDGRCDFAIFRPATGLWAVRGVTRAYFGSSGDLAVPGYYSEGPARPAIFRPATGLWAVRSLTRLYFGSSGDTPVPGDYPASGAWGSAIFRPGSGLWAVRGVSRLYFGSSGDTAVPGIYGGGGADQPAIFRSSTGLWAIRGLSRAYFGSSGDIPVTR